MKVLAVHNRYQRAGGEDVVFEAEAELLESRGHEVVRWVEDNDRIQGAVARVSTALAAVWNPRSHATLRAMLRRERPDLVHFHNTFPLISPAAHHAAAAEGVPVVQTLHNFRLICPMAQLFRDGSVCEDCVGRRVAWPGVVHACYRGSRVGSAAVATMLALHKGIGTWSSKVDRFIALTEFARSRFVEGGLPADRIRVKPNFLDPDPGMGEGGGGFALFVGRLSPEKGIGTLMSAWERLGGRIPLVVVGEGPEEARLAQPPPGVRWLGPLPRGAVLARMRQARLLVFPSEWYEGYPLVLVEAFAAGTPAVVSDLGAAATIVEEGQTGWRFRPGDPAHLAEVVERAWGRPDLASIRRRARAEFEAKYTASTNYDRLIEIYGEALSGPVEGRPREASTPSGAAR